MSIDELLQLAQQQRQSNNPAAAELTLRQLLRDHPNHPQALHALGNLLRSQRRLDEAIAAYRSALAANPNLLEAQGALAVALHEANRKPEAAAAFQKALDISAAPAYMTPQFALHHYQFGLLLQSIHHFQLAAESFQRAIHLAPDRHEPHQSLGIVYESLGQKSDAVTHYKLAIQKGASDPEALFHMTGLIGENFPPQQPPNSVAKLFDNMAATFDAHLHSLQYSAPQNLYHQLLKLTPENPNPNFGDIVDLGCGTGLCAELLKPHAKTLAGIDLSPNMLARAKTKNLYHSLLLSELVPALKNHPNSYDLAIAADVFIYIGNLTPLFTALQTALRKNALLAFSIEISETLDYQLLPTRRYAQSLNYIHNLAQTHHFKELTNFTAPLREETPHLIPGAFIIFQKQ